MNLKTKVKSYSFWVSLASALILILKLVGQKFGFAVDEGLISDLFTSLCAILVIMGIIVVPNSSSLENKTDIAQKPTVEPLVVVPLEGNESQSPKISQSENLELITNDESKILTSIKFDEVVSQQQSPAKIEEITNNEAPVELKVNAAATDIAETSQTAIMEQPEQEIQPNNISDEIVAIDPFDMSKKLESFIDKVCSKRSELSTNIAAFAEFLQTELDSVKNRNN